MRIVIDGRWIKQTGIGRYIENMLRELLVLDDANEYILLTLSQDVPKLSFKAPNLTLIEANYLWYSFSEQTKLLKLIKKLKPDLVHFTNFNFPIRFRSRFVITVHDLTLLDFKNINRVKLLPAIYHVKDRVMKRVIKVGIEKSVAIITPSNYVKKSLVERYKMPASKVFVTYEAANKSFPKATADVVKLRVTKPFILYVGNAYPHKNLERLILAYGKIITDYLLDYQLVIVGKKDAFHDRLEAEVDRAGLDEKVIFTDYVSDAELATLYKSASIYSFPSLSEGFGLPALEAMTYGLPIASSDATCLPEVLGDAVEYYNPKDTNDMARVMASLLSDKKRQTELVQKGYAQVQKYSWATTAKRTLAVYKHALKNVG